MVALFSFFSELLRDVCLAVHEPVSKYQYSRVERQTRESRWWTVCISQRVLAGFGAGCCAPSLSHRAPKGRAGCRGSLRALRFAVAAEESLSDLSQAKSTTGRKCSFVLLALSCLNFAGETTILHPVSLFPLTICWSHATYDFTTPAFLHSPFSLVLQQGERPRAEGSEPAPSQPTALADTAQDNPAFSRWHLGTKGPFRWQHLSCAVPCADQRIKKWIFVSWQFGTEPGDRNLQNQQHLLLVVSVILAISKGKTREKRPVETWGGFPILTSQHLLWHPNTHAWAPQAGWIKAGQGGQAAIAAQSWKGQEEERVPVGNCSCRIPLKNIWKILQAGLNTAETGWVWGVLNSVPSQLLEVAQVGLRIGWERMEKASKISLGRSWYVG